MYIPNCGCSWVLTTITLFLIKDHPWNNFGFNWKAGNYFQFDALLINYNLISTEGLTLLESEEEELFNRSTDFVRTTEQHQYLINYYSINTPGIIKGQLTLQ